MKTRLAFLALYFLIIAAFLCAFPTGRAPAAQQTHEQQCERIKFDPNLWGEAWIEAMKTNGCECK